MTNLAEIGIQIVEAMPADRPEQTVALLEHELCLDHPAAEAAFVYFREMSIVFAKIRERVGVTMQM